MRGHKDWAVIFPQASATSSKLPKARAQLIGRRVSFHAPSTHYQIMNLVEGSPVFSPSGLRKLRQENEQRWRPSTLLLHIPPNQNLLMYGENK